MRKARQVRVVGRWRHEGTGKGPTVPRSSPQTPQSRAATAGEPGGTHGHHTLQPAVTARSGSRPRGLRAPVCAPPHPRPGSGRTSRPRQPPLPGLAEPGVHHARLGCPGSGSDARAHVLPEGRFPSYPLQDPPKHGLAGAAATATAAAAGTLRALRGFLRIGEREGHQPSREEGGGEAAVDAALAAPTSPRAARGGGRARASEDPASERPPAGPPP